jgi:hypothetical protein
VSPNSLEQREVRSSFLVLIIGVVAKKKERKDEEGKKREGGDDGRGVKLHDAIAMSSKLI